VLWFSRNQHESEQQFREVVKVAPEDAVANFYLGLREFENQQFQKAKAHFSKSGSLAFKNPEAFDRVLETSLVTGDRSLTDRLLRSAESLGQSHPEVWFQAGTVFGRHQEYESAIAAFEKIRDRYPDRLALISSLGLAQLRAGRYPDAVRSLEDLVRLEPSSAENYLLLAEACEGTKDLQKAYDAYNKAIETAPGSDVVYTALSKFAVAHHNPSFALKVLEQGLARLPSSPRLLLQQGVVQALDDKGAAAEESFRQARAADPKWMLPWLALGVTQLQAAKLEQAIPSFQQAARLAGGDHRPHYLLALTWVRQGGQERAETRREIVSALQASLSLNPGHAESRVLLGQTYLAGDQIDLAISELEKAVKLEADNRTALYQLGLAYRRQGKLAEAQRLLKEFEFRKLQQKEADELARKELVYLLRVVKDR
jgi:superkiller protein 3